MTATDELRRLLDGRGVEWQDFDGEPTWMGSDGEMHYARQEFTFNGPTDNVTVYHLTPEQAVEATLGRGTCRDCKHFRSHGDDYLFCDLAARELDGGDGFCSWGERRDA